MAEPKFSPSVVVFAAHPDDTEIFTAGTLKLLHDRGFRITVCTVTAGGMGGLGSDEAGTIARRRKEAEAAARLLDAEYVCLGGRDGFLYDTEALRLAAGALIRRVKAGIVITHLPMDYHADHRATCAIVEAAAMLATLPNVPCGEPPLEATPLLYHSATLGLTDPLGNPLAPPHFFVNLDTVEAFKMQMLACHQSQIDLMRLMHHMDDFFGEMQKQDLAWGAEAGCRFAEAWWQHLGGGFPKTPLIQDVLKDYLIVKTKKGNP
ncbi:MAG TPA: PIG-L deacetylase family protein [Spirochaetia bacterium]|jgi:LmbE family N-acetylglucosaminyl deacetylase|nr:PIG-L deacetylase family protein [Spirochaetia bacterium]